MGKPEWVLVPLSEQHIAVILFFFPVPAQPTFLTHIAYQDLEVCIGVHQTKAWKSILRKRRASVFAIYLFKIHPIRMY